MSRKSKRELERELEAMDDTGEDGAPPVMVLAPPKDSVSDDLLVPITTEYDGASSFDREDDPIDRAEKVAVPIHLPPDRYNGVAVIDSAEEIEALWREMPEEVRELELESRREHGEPIPPFLEAWGADR